jgi:hypothetical protein
MKVFNHIFVTEKAAMVQNRRAVLAIVSLERSLRNLIECVLDKYPKDNEILSVLEDGYKSVIEDHRLSTEDIRQYKIAISPCYWEQEDSNDLEDNSDGK